MWVTAAFGPPTAAARTRAVGQGESGTRHRPGFAVRSGDRAAALARLSANPGPIDKLVGRRCDPGIGGLVQARDIAQTIGPFPSLAAPSAPGYSTRRKASAAQAGRDHGGRCCRL